MDLALLRLLPTAATAHSCVDWDSRVNVGDVAKIYTHVRDSEEIDDEYSYECADVSGDGSLTVGETAKVYSHIRGTSSLWN